MNENPINIIGSKVKALRESKDISLADLAERSGLDIGFCRSLEENMELPTIGDLIKVSRALGIRLGMLLDDYQDEGPVVHRADNRKWEKVLRSSGNENSGIAYYSLSSRKGNRHMETYSLEIEPSVIGEKHFSNHEGEEFLYVLSGEVELFYGKETYILKQGDSIYYDSIVPHHISSASQSETARLLAVIYTPA